MNNIETNPEFASEIVLSIPYCYYLHQRGELGQVVVCKGMKPFYYFADNVVEGFDYRSLDNEVALKDIPNKWLHNSEAGGRRAGVIDYSQWECPPYEEYYKNNLFDDLKPYVIVNNIYNIEPTGEYVRYFNHRNLRDFFILLGKKKYNVVYKRPNNTEFILDPNELHTIHINNELTAKVGDLGIINDWDFCNYFENAFDMNKLWKESGLDYSTFNLNTFSEAEGFISIHGGGVQLCAYFEKPLIIYTNTGKGLREGYVENKNSYLNRLSNHNVHHIKDDVKEWEKNGGRNYEDIAEKIFEVF
jgi:hypothetical protein